MPQSNYFLFSPYHNSPKKLSYPLGLHIGIAIVFKQLIIDAFEHPEMVKTWVDFFYPSEKNLFNEIMEEGKARVNIAGRSVYEQFIRLLKSVNNLEKSLRTFFTRHPEIISDEIVYHIRKSAAIACYTLPVDKELGESVAINWRHYQDNFTKQLLPPIADVYQTEIERFIKQVQDKCLTSSSTEIELAREIVDANKQLQEIWDALYLQSRQQMTPRRPVPTPPTRSSVDTVPEDDQMNYSTLPKPS